MIRNILLILSFLVFVSCEYNPRCIDAPDFGDPKVGFDSSGKDVTLKYPAADVNYSWLMQSSPIESGYVLTGERIIGKIDGAWSPWINNELTALSAYNNILGSDRVCDYATDFTSCSGNPTSNASSVASSCFQPIFDANMNPKKCWYIEGVGLYVGFSQNPDEGVIQYFHVADYFNTSPQGYPQDWYFDLDPSLIDIDGQSLLDYLSLGPDEYSSVKVYTRVLMYDYDSNHNGIIRDDINPETGTLPNKLDLVDGDVVASNSSPTITMYQGVRLQEPVYTESFADVIFSNASTLIEALFNSFVGSSYLGALINVSLTLLISYLGIAFFLGLTRFSMQEMIGHLLRVGLVLTIVNADEGWDFFNHYIIGFVWDGSQQIASDVMIAVNTAVIETVTNTDEYIFVNTVQSSIFNVVDQVIKLFLSNETHTKIWAIAISHQFGIFIVLLMYLCIFFFLVALIKFALSLLFVYFTLIILLGIGPVMFVFLMFGFTRDYFMKWIQNLVSAFLQPVLFMIFFGPFATLAVFYLKKLLYLEVCWNIWFLPPLFDLFGYWSVESSYEYDDDTNNFVKLGYYEPNYFDMLILTIVSFMLYYITDKIPEMGQKLSGGFSFATSIAPIFTKAFDQATEKVGKTAAGATYLAGKQITRKAIIDSGNLLSSTVGKVTGGSIAAGISGTRENNFLKAQSNIKNNLRDRGFTEAEINYRIKSDENVKLNIADDFMRLQSRTREKYTLKGALGSVKVDMTNADGKFDSGSPLRLITSVGNRLLAAQRLSQSKDLRTKGMRKLQRQQLSDQITGTGKYRKEYMKRNQEGDDKFSSTSSIGKAVQDRNFINKKLNLNNMDKFQEDLDKRTKFSTPSSSGQTTNSNSGTTSRNDHSKVKDSAPNIIDKSKDLTNNQKRRLFFGKNSGINQNKDD